MSQISLLFPYWKSMSQVYEHVRMKGFGFRAALFLIDDNMMSLVTAAEVDHTDILFLRSCNVTSQSNANYNPH